jgi:asparagine synthase (glutamine-hydrolysing)
MKVVLSGQGGDEVFGGYSTFHYARRLSRLKSIRGLPGPGRRFGATLLSVARGRTAGEDKAVEYVLQADNALDAYLVLRRYFSAPSRIALLGGAATTNGALAQGLPTDQYRRLLEESAPLDPVNEVALFETRVYLANTLLRDGDVMSMAHSLELRVPFLDHRLVELLAQVPGSLKVQPGRQKPLLVDAVGADLPEAVYRRPKMGFTLPWSRWLKSGLRTTIEPVLLSRDMAERAGLAPAACRGVWERFLEGRPGYSWSRPWALFVLMDWCRRHSVEVKK